MKSWQHHTDILVICSVGKRSAVIGKPVRQSFTVKLCRIGCDCGYDLLMVGCVGCDCGYDLFSRVWNWKPRGTVVSSIRGQRVGIRGQHMDGREDRINIHSKLFN